MMHALYFGVNTLRQDGDFAGLYRWQISDRPTWIVRNAG
jgi:hypothetical protein